MTSISTGCHSLMTDEWRCSKKDGKSTVFFVVCMMLLYQLEKPHD